MRYLSFLVFFLIILCHFLISGHDLDGPFYWDESVYADIAHHPLTTDFYATDNQIFSRHPPLLMILQSVLLKLPFTEEISLRFLSLIFSSLGLLYLFIIGSKLKYPLIALLTCVVLIFHTQFQQYSQSATMYALFFFFSMWLCYGYVFQKNWMQVFALVGCLYTHYFGFVWVAAFVSLEWKEFGFRFLALYWKKYLSCLILYLPWIYFMISAIGFHKSKAEATSIHLNLANIAMIFGLGTVIVILFWQKKTKFYLIHKRVELFHSKDRFLVWSLGMIPYIMLLLLFARPYIRYLYAFFPLVFLGVAIFLFDYFEVKKFKKKWFYPTFILCLMIPNVFVFGIFPHSSRYYDKNDNPHYDDFREVIKFIGGRSVTLTNVRSYYYYYQKFFKELPKKQFPWEEIGIHEFLNGYFFQLNSEFVVIRKDELSYAMETASFSDYEVEKEFANFLIFKKSPLIDETNRLPFLSSH